MWLLLLISSVLVKKDEKMWRVKTDVKENLDRRKEMENMMDGWALHITTSTTTQPLICIFLVAWRRVNLLHMPNNYVVCFVSF